VCGAAGSEAVRARQEVLLVDALQHHRHRSLQHFVLEGRDAEGTLLAMPLVDLGTAHWWRSVAAGLEALVQVGEVALEVLRVLLRRLSVDSRCAVLARASMCFPQEGDIDVMGQTREHRRGTEPRQLCYPQEFRGRGLGARLLRHVAHLRLCSPGTPFPLLGPSGRVPQLRRYYGMLRLLDVHLAPLRCLRSAIPLVLTCSSDHRQVSTAAGPGGWSGGLRPPSSGGDIKLSRVPRKPDRCVPLSRDPGGFGFASPCRRPDAAFRHPDGVGTLALNLSGFDERPAASLSTLRRLRHLGDARLASGWWLTFAGRFTPLGLAQGFARHPVISFLLA
jgi:hypothetical protein